MRPVDTTADALWKRRFRADAVSWMLVAVENPTRAAVVLNRSGVNQLYAWEIETGELRQVTNHPTGVRYGFISPDGNSIFYFEDRSGNELGHYVSVPFGGGPSTNLTPDLPPFSFRPLSSNRDGAWLGLLVVDSAGSHVYGLHDGEHRHLYTSPKRATEPIFSAAGDLAAIATTERSTFNQFSIVLVDVASGINQAELYDAQANLLPHMFSPVSGDNRLLGHSSASGFTRPFIWDIETDAADELPLSELEGDLYAWDWSRDARRILLCQVSHARSKLYIFDLISSELRGLNHPSGRPLQGYFAGDKQILTTFTDTASPGCVLALGDETGGNVLLAGESFPACPWKSVTFASQDGTKIQAWLTTPEGGGPFPTIIDIHGGPMVAQMEEFHPHSQAWLDHGFAWLSVNYRGSTTFGTAFERAIWGRFGTDEVWDIVAARNWLISNEIARRDAVFLTGWSYGGTLTLQVLGRAPEGWAGAMAGIAMPIGRSLMRMKRSA